MPKNSTQIESKSISKSIREYWSADGTTPLADNQINGLHIGIVMKDDDDMNIGRVWVYFPDLCFTILTVSGALDDSMQPGNLDNPNPDASSWIICYPMLPFYGSDANRQGREKTTGRNAYALGQANSYGMFFHPRKGDYIGALFANGDPAQGYWIGCVPKPNQNFMTPGHAGILVENGNLPPQRVPSLENDPDSNTVRRETRSFSDNLRISGLIFDHERGAGTASPTRESPSYIMGMKSQGWTYETEKNQTIGGDGPNKNKLFSNFPNQYKDIETMGHQLIMDDHPDHQAVRLRSGLGAQLYINDVESYIYINTQQGNVWMQFDDTGRIDVYCQDSINVHSEGDMNFTCDGDYNLEVGGDYNLVVHGNKYTDQRGTTTEVFGYGSTSPANAYQAQYYGTVDIQYDLNYHVTGLADISLSGVNNYFQSSQETNINCTGDLLITGAGNISIKASNTLYLDTNLLDLYTSGQFVIESGDTINISSSNDISMYATNTTYINGVNIALMQSLPIPEKTTVPIATVAPIAAEADVIDFGVQFGVPTSSDVENGTVPVTFSYLGNVVPQHEPWAGHPNVTAGTNNMVDYDTSTVQTTRIGALSSQSTKALNFVGIYNGQSGVFVANNYSTTSIGEVPSYSKVGNATLTPCSSLSISPIGINFIKGKEGFSQCPYKDASGFSCGWGHFIVLNDNIGGTIITPEILQSLYSSTSGYCNILQINRTQADELFLQDIPKYENIVKKYITTNLTEGQFDCLCSGAYNIGSALFFSRKTGTLTKFAQYMNANMIPQAITEYLGFCKSQGVVLDVLANRRKEEIQQLFCMGAPPDVSSNTPVNQ